MPSLIPLSEVSLQGFLIVGSYQKLRQIRCANEIHSLAFSQQQLVQPSVDLTDVSELTLTVLHKLAKETEGFDIVTRLFQNFSARCGMWSLAGLDTAAKQCPVAGITNRRIIITV